MLRAFLIATVIGWASFAHARDAVATPPMECSELLDLLQDSKADGDSIRGLDHVDDKEDHVLSQDEMAMLWAMVQAKEGWEAWALWRPAILIHHLSPAKDGKPAHYQWKAFFLDGHKICYDLSLDKNDMELFTRMYASDSADSN